MYRYNLANVIDRKNKTTPCSHQCHTLLWLRWIWEMKIACYKDGMQVVACGMCTQPLTWVWHQDYKSTLPAPEQPESTVSSYIASSESKGEWYIDETSNSHGTIAIMTNLMTIDAIAIAVLSLSLNFWDTQWWNKSHLPVVTHSMLQSLCVAHLEKVWGRPHLALNRLRKRSSRSMTVSPTRSSAVTRSQSITVTVRTWSRGSVAGNS